MSSRLQLDMRNLSLGRRYLVNAYEVEAGIGVIAGNTVWSMPERLECEVTCSKISLKKSIKWSLEFRVRLRGKYFVQPCLMQITNVTDRQTDWQTDDIAYAAFACNASCGKDLPRMIISCSTTCILYRFCSEIDSQVLVGNREFFTSYLY